MEEETKKEEVPSLDRYKQKVGEFLLMEDDGVVDVIAAAVIGNMLDRDPIWLMVTGPSSSGKTELLNPLSDLPFITSISDLTANTFASGYKAGGGKEASLLLQIQNGILVFKDFTSLLTKSRETRDEILGQMRRIFDGEYEKKTGTGEEISWKGKIGVIAAATNAVYKSLANTSEMGQRFIYYSIEQPNRFEAADMAQLNASHSAVMRGVLREEFKIWALYVLERIEKDKIDYQLPEELRREMLRVADFSSLARSPVSKDFKSGLVDEIVDKEMPGRMVKQMEGLVAAFSAINQAEGTNLGTDRKYGVSAHQRKVVYRTGYHSISVMRRKVLYLLAKHRPGVMTAGVATSLDLPTESVRKYLQEVNAVGICVRRKEGGKQGDKWIMTDENYRKVVMLVEGVTPEDTILIGKEEDIDDSEPTLDSYHDELKQRANAKADKDFEDYGK